MGPYGYLIWTYGVLKGYLSVLMWNCGYLIDCSDVSTHQKPSFRSSEALLPSIRNDARDGKLNAFFPPSVTRYSYS